MSRSIVRMGSQSSEVQVPPPPVAGSERNPYLSKLQEGNMRYVSGTTKSAAKLPDEQNARTRLSDFGQEPWAILLSCSDSRVPVERIFDAGPGDLFVVRVAGNITGSPAGGLIGSVEYGVEHLKSKIVLVLGHTKCGAVTTAVKLTRSGGSAVALLGPNLGAAIEHIGEPAEEALQALETLENPTEQDHIDEAIRLNVLRGMEQLMTRSSTAAQAVREQRVEIHGGIYDIATGTVRFLGQHPRQRAILRESRRKAEEAEMKGSDVIDLDDEDVSAMRKSTTGGSCKAAAHVSNSSSSNSQDFVMLGVMPGQQDEHSPVRHRSIPVAFGNDSPRDLSPGSLSPGRREDHEEAQRADSHIPRIPKFSWYVETKVGRQHLKDVVLDPNNWRAGITVALVSVPLSISLGIASGTTPMRGLASAVFGGLCAGIFGSSDYNIVGPAGALSGMLMSYTVKWGDDILPWLSLFSAAICAVCWLLRLDAYMLLMPTSVFEGFTVGVALIIGLNQINFACGLVPGAKHALFVMNIMESVKELGATKWPSLIFFLIQAPLLFVLMRQIPKIPWTIIMPVLSIPLGFLGDQGTLGFDLLTLKSKYGMLKPELVQPLKPLDAEPAPLFIAALSIAIVAVLETLISAKIASTRVDRSFSLTGEMRGLTISHVVCGLTGAMPPTGVFVRTSLNTSLGATHRFSQTLNAIMVGLISLAFMPLFSYLPQATIAAILVVAAVRMTPFNYLKQLWQEDKRNLLLCLVTAAICVGEDPVIGLAVGMVLAFLAGAKSHLKAPIVDISSVADGDGGRAFRIEVFGALTYVNAEVFTKQARTIANARKIALDLSGMRQVDHDGISAIGKVLDKWSSGDQPTPRSRVSIEGVCDHMLPTLRQAPWFVEAEEQGRVKVRAAAAGKVKANVVPREQAVRRGGA